MVPPHDGIGANASSRPPGFRHRRETAGDFAATGLSPAVPTAALEKKKKDFTPGEYVQPLCVCGASGRQLQHVEFSPKSL